MRSAPTSRSSSETRGSVLVMGYRIGRGIQIDLPHGSLEHRGSYTQTVVGAEPARGVAVVVH